VEARPPSAWYRVRKFVLRNKAAVATAAVLLAAGLAVAGTVGWTVRARSAERAEAGRRAGDFLGDADRLEQAGQWPEAMALVERAEAVLGRTGDARLRDRVGQRKRVLALVLGVEAVRLGMVSGRDEDFDFPLGDRLFAEVFREYGVDVDALAPAEVAAGLPEGAARGEAVAALDDWARVRREIRGEADRAWEHLLAAARAADPDPWRDRVRALWQRMPLFYESWANENGDEWRKRTLVAGWDRFVALVALKELLATAPLDRVPPGVVIYLVQLARHPAVLAMLREVQRRRPGDFWINHTLAKSLVRDWAQSREAVPFFRVALALRPDSPAVLTNLGKALCDAKQFDEAIATCDRALRLKPDFAGAHINRGAALASKGAHGEAVAAFRAAVRLQPSHWGPHFNLGVSLFQLGRFGEAIDALRESVRLRPGNAWALFYLGNALGKTGAADEAIAAYREAMRLRPNTAGAYSGLGTVLYEHKQDYDGAIAAFRRAVELQPDYHHHYTNLGIALAQKGGLVEAATAYREAVRLKPGDEVAHRGLARALGLNGDWGEVVVVLRELVRHHPGNAEFHAILGDALSAKGDLDEAIAEFREAFRLKLDEARWHHKLCIVFIQKRAWADAAAAARDAIRLKPDFAEAHCNLGQALRRLGRYEEALAALRRGHELGSRNPNWQTPSAQWIKECEIQAAVAGMHRAPPPTEVAPPPRPRD
jgi:Flp pilus assembly protein TadD